MVLKGPYVPNIRRVIVPTGGPRRGKARSIWIYSGVSSTTLLYRRVSLFGPWSVDAPELRRCRGYKIGRLWKRINPWGARGGGHAGSSFIAFGAFCGKYSRIDRVGRTSGTKIEGYLLPCLAFRLDFESTVLTKSSSRTAGSSGEID